MDNQVPSTAKLFAASIALAAIAGFVAYTVPVSPGASVGRAQVAGVKIAGMGPTSTPISGPAGYSCYDRDGGNNLYVSGELSGTLPSGRSFQAVDSCADSLNVNEVVCGNLPTYTNGYFTNKQKCPGSRVCKFGACVTPSSTAPVVPNNYSCTDSDNGVDIYVSGAVTSATGTRPITTAYDRCVSTTTLYENYCDSTIASGIRTMVVTCPNGNSCSNGRCVAMGQLYVTSSPMYTYETVYVGQRFVSTTAIVLTAKNEPVIVRSLRFTSINSSNNPLYNNQFDNIRLTVNNNIVAASPSMNCSRTTGTCDLTWSAASNLLGTVIQPGSPVIVKILVDIKPAGQVVLGSNFKMSVAAADIQSVGANSGAAITATGAIVTPKNFTTIIPFDVYVNAVGPTPGSVINQTILTGTQIGRFVINNSGTSKITVRSLKFNDYGQHQGSTTTYKLYYSDQNSSNYTGNIASSTNGNLDFGRLSDQGTTFTIDGGARRYVTVVINSPGSIIRGDSFQLFVKQFGDLKYNIAETDLGYDSNNSGSIVGWSNEIPISGTPILGTLIKQ